MGERAATQEEINQQAHDMIFKWVEDEGQSEDSLKDSLLSLAMSTDVTNCGTKTVDASDGESRAKRSKLSDDRNTKPQEGGTLRTNESLPKTLKELALYFVEHCRDDETLGKVKFFLGNGKELLMLKPSESKDTFRERIEGSDEEAFLVLMLGGFTFSHDEFDAEKALRQVNSTIYPPARLVKEINCVCSPHVERGDDIPNWEESFVVAEDPSQLNNVNFPVDMPKGAALVVTGESGSGKSWFAKYFVPNKLGKDDTAHIYYTLSDEDVANFQPEKSDPTVRHACKVGMHHLDSMGMSSTPVYEYVSELSSRINSERNREARKLLKSIISKVLKDSKDASTWWEATESPVTVKKLIVVVDEVGKAPGLARGLVDEVRNFYDDITGRGRAEKVLLVLVGSGLDHHIRDDTLDFEIKTKADEEFKSSMASFGTDPRKSNVIVLKGPDLKEGGTFCGVATKDITEGTYSRVLATNTRMLTRGIMPIFKSSILMQGTGTELSMRRRVLGSTNIVMDYAARVYVDLNGLQRLDASALESVLLTQFRLLMHAKLKSQGGGLLKQLNPVFQGIMNDLRPTPTDFEDTLNRGLITADFANTSNALCYLACGGRTAPLDAQDGIAFEIILQHHLVRLSQACHNRNIQQEQDPNQRSKKENEKASEDEIYFCGQYDLRQAWPPSSSKGDGRLVTCRDVEDELAARYDGCQDDDHDDADVDVTKIVELVGNKAKFDLVMRQTVSNVQGADVLVLSKADAVISLDMYQAKHYKTIPGPTTKSIKSAFSSLGVAIVGDDIHTEPVTGSAGFSYLGTRRFAESLKQKLGTKVLIRKRVLVFSKDWEALSSQTGWGTFKFEKAYEKGLMLWTREMMEPTISVLDYVPSSSQDDVSS